MRVGLLRSFIEIGPMRIAYRAYRSLFHFTLIRIYHLNAAHFGRDFARQSAVVQA